MSNKSILDVSCPLPISDYPKVLMSHGSGGRMSNQLIEKVFMQAFKNDELLKAHDGAVFDVPAGRMAISTDSYVINPIFFPGGDIGDLAVNGTVNDISMCGAKPLYLSAAFIIEEGFLMEDLWKIVQSMRKAADIAGVKIVTGDTKVVNKGACDGIFINTTGVGVIDHDKEISPKSINAGDVVVINGDVGRHGMAIMAIREGLEFETDLESDTAPLNHIVQKMLSEGIRVSCLRDVTRGGLSSVVNEIAVSANKEIVIEEKDVLVDPAVRSACEILGLNPMQIANEGKFIAFVHPDDEKKALEIMNGCKIGCVSDISSGRVMLNTPIGGSRILDMPSGELLPRIC